MIMMIPFFSKYTYIFRIETGPIARNIRTGNIRSYGTRDKKGFQLVMSFGIVHEMDRN